MTKTDVKPPEADAHDDEFRTVLVEHLRAGYQCMYVHSVEESRLETEIKRAGAEMQLPVVTWDIANGFDGERLPDSIVKEKKYMMPHEALRVLGVDKVFPDPGAIFVFRDLDDYLNDPTVRRVLKGLVEGNKLMNKRYKRPLIIISASSKIHDKLKSSMTVLEFKLPKEKKLRHVMKFLQRSIEATDKVKAQCSDELADKIVACLRGLTSIEAENVLSRCIVRHDGFKEEMLGTIKDEKASIIKKSEVLTYIPEEQQVGRDSIGGFGDLLQFLDRRRLAYGREATAINLDYPKGVVLLGVPGTGKSLVAKAVCKLLGLPGYIMDVGSVFGSLVGESEQRMRQALQQVEAQQGCVLVLDEADKAFGGATDSQGDSGVTRRVFGQLLTWLAEKNDRTFVIMTLNRTKGIPPEFLRAGRFDAVFYTDIPHEQEREQILRIHMRRRGVDPNAYNEGDWKQLVDKTDQFVGAELEEVIREARYSSFEARRAGNPNIGELLTAASAVTPISRIDAEAVQAIREFCQSRAKPVSTPLTKKRRAEKEQRGIDLSTRG